MLGQNTSQRRWEVFCRTPAETTGRVIRAVEGLA